MLKTVEYQRGYDAGYKQALLDAVRAGAGSRIEERELGPRPSKRRQGPGPNGLPRSIYDVD